MALKSRYNGKPMLRILECYVLWAIGELGKTEEEKLQQTAPKLRQVFGQPGGWREIVAKSMELPNNMPELIRSNWEENQEIAKERRITLNGQQFAEMFVDNNLAK